MKQQRMFETQDLPLFSGTAPKGKVKKFDPKPVARQECLAERRICLDTGTVDGRPCWCQAKSKGAIP